MPKIIIHAPTGAFDAAARRGVAGELTDLALDCEALPKSPFMASMVWTFFNDYAGGAVFMGDRPARVGIVSVQILAIRGGLDGDAKTRLIKGATAILGRHLGLTERPPVHIVLHEVAATDWGMFGENPDLTAMRASPADAPAMA
ncbi:4-oxalocrotonate tautomerase [Azospirillum sp. RWY-5-1]|uniref:4-oxalocrotonate tautomerase n=1 Tax=Azospirillum oleiclasticum TaxID=2735135 RepID=A0ABX2TIL7_9PROT|nr:tautomerase family protein [Azospirillum oleiclasticum]NYZ16601.1 4-oxalocrotonate tautomerase [Azospirillum oleiclasticum]NYZ24088.1 4-oxalocrotonate tautomerase [Azospirillum oleiclasticum]